MRLGNIGTFTAQFEVFDPEVMTPRHSRHGQCMSPALTLPGYVGVITHPQSVFANHSAVMVIT